MIKVNHVRKTYRSKVSLFSKARSEGHYALNDISFEMGKGVCFGLLGRNGAGKSTLVKILTGIIYPTEGLVEVMGYTPQQRDSRFLQQIGAIFGHKSALWWDLPPMDSFEAARVLYNVDKTKYKQKLSELVDSLGLSRVLSRPVRNLSLGERVKCELAANLIHEPQLIFLDEPTVGLDLSSKFEIRQYLNRQKTEKNLTIVLTSHDTGDIEGCCDQIIILHKGSIEYQGNIAELHQDGSPEHGTLEEVLFERYRQLESAEDATR